MAKRGRVKMLEEMYPDFEEQLVKAVNQYDGEGQKVAAEIFGLSQATVCTELSKRGYKRTIRYVKQMEQAS